MGGRAKTCFLFAILLNKIFAEFPILRKAAETLKRKAFPNLSDPESDHKIFKSYPYFAVFHWLTRIFFGNF